MSLVLFWIAIVFSVSAIAIAFAMIIWFVVYLLLDLRINIKPIHDDLKFLCIKVSLPPNEVENDARADEVVCDDRELRNEEKTLDDRVRSDDEGQL